MAYVDSARAPAPVFEQALPAEFVVSSDGVVGKFGVAMELAMGASERIWFERVE